MNEIAVIKQITSHQFMVLWGISTGLLVEISLIILSIELVMGFFFLYIFLLFWQKFLAEMD